MDKPIIGRDLQVAIMNNDWVRPLKHPGCKYGYMKYRDKSYLVSERFIDFEDEHYPTEKKFKKCMRELGMDWKEILERQLRCT